MKQRKPRIAVLAVGRSTFDVEYAQTVFASAWQGLRRLNAEIVGEEQLYFDADAALAAFARLNDSDIDLFLLLQVTFTDASVCAEIASRLEVPLVLWTFPEARTGGRLRLNSFCGVNLAAHTLSRKGRRLENVHGAPDSKEALQQIQTPPRPRPSCASWRAQKSSSSAIIPPASMPATTTPPRSGSDSASNR